jgi:GT2 family glycosyltransferase
MTVGPENRTKKRENPETSVIVINMNGLQFLQACFSTLGRQIYTDFETLLVDNGSTDGSVKFVKENFPHVIILELGRNFGFGGGNNQGIKAARGKYIALLNNDTEVHENWLAELVRGIKSDPIVAMCASKLVFADNPGIVDSAGDELFWFGQTFSYRHYPADHPAVTKARRCFSACAGAALYRRDVLDKVGLFDEIYGLGYYEDVDLGFRAQLQGYECLYVPTAIVHHKVSGTMKLNLERYTYLNQRNIEYLLFINNPAFLLMSHLPFRMLYLTGNFLAHLIRGFGTPFLQAKIDFLRTMPAAWRKRCQVQRRRMISVKELRAKLMKGWLRYKFSFGPGKQ